MQLTELRNQQLKLFFNVFCNVPYLNDDTSEDVLYHAKTKLNNRQRASLHVLLDSFACVDSGGNVCGAHGRTETLTTCKHTEAVLLSLYAEHLTKLWKKYGQKKSDYATVLYGSTELRKKLDDLEIHVPWKVVEKARHLGIVQSRYAEKQDVVKKAEKELYEAILQIST